MTAEIDAIIPAWNEEKTIGEIVRVLIHHPKIHHVWVCVDWKTTDNTAALVKQQYASVIHEETMVDKGSCVSAGLDYVDTDRVLFCDGDLTGLTTEHVSLLTRDHPGSAMVIGVPDYPRFQDIPARFANRRFFHAWPWVSGQRCLSTAIARKLPLYGYLMETQINMEYGAQRRPILFEFLEGLHSPLDLNPRRLRDMDRQTQYGRRMGIIESTES